MDDRVQPAAGAWIGEDDGAENPPIDGARSLRRTRSPCGARDEDAITECTAQLAPGDAPGRDHLVPDAIGIDEGGAEALELPGGGGLPRRNAPGQPDDHVRIDARGRLIGGHGARRAGAAWRRSGRQATRRR